ncbi:SCO family protein [Polyangium aurulentum]|uniref:SCO family protein n=1 Tax=Polyangium aurulentum TaxID=2567896 RepID=UPI0010AEC128|nr:SCO family protein [Polyangium aurulentum]UQA59333.1 SCO family protein [Polyangium aurulentum]
MRSRWTSCALALFCALAPAGGATAEENRGKTPTADEAAARYFTDTELVDQGGKPRHFYSDLLRGKKVLINFGFTSCKGVCPTMTANLARVQKLLGARVGSEIVMITLSVDPVNDTPAVLDRFAKKFGVGPGWYFLTGTPGDVKTVLGRVGGLVKKPEEHSAVLLVGDLKTGFWVKSLATARPEDIVYLVDHLNDEKTARAP